MITPTFQTPDIELIESPDGQILRSRQPLQAYERCTGEMLIRWAEKAPERTFLAERQGDGWRTISYSETLTRVKELGAALLQRGGPVVILSQNSINHALLALAAQLVGLPAVPVSVAYSTKSSDHAKIRHILQLVKPALVYADDASVYGAALSHVTCETVTDATIDQLTGSADVDAAMASVGPDTVAKVLFTSGSIGVPKGVINTQRMICSNQQMISQCWPFLATEPPVLLDWLPWNHTFGGNHNFNMVLKNGGTMYIDNGRPAPGLVEHTVANLRDICPTLYFNVPAGFAHLIPALTKDRLAAESLFKRLRLVFYAGAALPQDLWERLEALSTDISGKKVLFTSAWGATETSPLATSTHFVVDRAGIIGVPAPGVELKLSAVDGQLEARVRGPNITPGYLGDAPADAFDADGFYCSGDAVRLADPSDPNRGIVFVGRTAEDFKLATGTWVRSGAVRVAALAAAEVLQDAVVAGHAQAEIGLLAWLKPTAPVIGIADLLRARLAVYNANNDSSSKRIGRVILLTEQPSIDAGEITDKGYINQGAVLRGRAKSVAELFAGGEGVILL